jgi:homocysteine S-methyltransferase
MSYFVKALKEGVLVADGSMATMLYQKGIYINRSFEEVNLLNPFLIKEIHLAYAKAGADILTTNTFGANYWHLKHYGLEGRITEINKEAVRLAREVTNKELFLAATIGSISPFINPPFKEDDFRKGYEVQIKTLAKEEIDVFFLKSFLYLDSLLLVIKLIKQWTNIPIIATLSVEEGEKLSSGENVGEIISTVEGSGILGGGFSCSQGPKHILHLIEAVKDKTSFPLIAIPNAGLPKGVEGRKIYLCTPEYLARYSRYYIQNGVKIVGGCCGITPNHIRAVKAAVYSLKPKQFVYIKSLAEPRAEPPTTKTIYLEEYSDLAKRLVRGKFVTSIELTPPKGPEVTKVLEKAKLIKEMGIDAINIPDGPRATARLSAQALAALVEQKVGVETILHICGRDRNLIGLQADLLGSYVLGVRNLLIITGDPPKLGDYPNASAVFDLDAIGLIHLAKKLNAGLDFVGRPIDGQTSFLIGAGVNPMALNLERELERFEAKIKAGAQFAITQPIFEPKGLERFIAQIKHFNIPIIAGLWPLTSYKGALFMKNDVPGVVVTEEVIKRMAKAKNGEEALATGVAIARELFDALKDIAQGVQISAPLGRVEMVVRILGLKD